MSVALWLFIRTHRRAVSVDACHDPRVRVARRTVRDAPSSSRIRRVRAAVGRVRSRGRTDSYVDDSS